MPITLTDLLPLNRPEYPGSTEAVLSALAWSLVENPEAYPPLVYEMAQQQTTKKRRFPVSQCRPLGVTHVQAALASSGIAFPSSTDMDDAVLDALRGVIPAKAFSYPALPLVRAAAFLQNPRGVKAKKEPANYALIIEQLYALGSPVQTHQGAATKWFSILTIPETNSLFRSLDILASQMVPTTEGTPAPVVLREPATSVSASPHPLWLADVATPFVWFRQAWDTFCTPEWRNALPRRRWSDWASCIIRTAMGMSYLWEAYFYRDLCTYLAASTPPVPFELPKYRDLLKWTARDEALTTRDVNSRIRQVISIGHAARLAFRSCIETLIETRPELATCSLQQVVKAVSQTLAGQTNPFAALLNDSKRNQGPNTWETVVYSLQCRAETGSDADFYSVLSRRSRRFLVVEPGPEWLVVIASLAAGAPGRQTTLGQVKANLAMLGLFPTRETLVQELEQAGLAGSSHDADDALEVVSAF